MLDVETAYAVMTLLAVSTRVQVQADCGPRQASVQGGVSLEGGIQEHIITRLGCLSWGGRGDPAEHRL